MSEAGSSRRKPAKAGRREYREMTVALIREAPGTDIVQVAFSESARFYKLERKNPEFEEVLRELREAKEKGRAVRVLVNPPNGDVIEDAQAAD
jgi:predicted TIM-barrel fold metal-dependent hydrolase